MLTKRISAVLESSTRKRFKTGTAPDGTSWKPSVRALFKGGKTLVQSARLRDSFQGDSDEHRAAVGTNLIYALIHQLGGIIRAKGGGALRFMIPGVGWRQVAQVKIPARPMVGVSATDRVDIAEQVERYSINAAGAIASAHNCDNNSYVIAACGTGSWGGQGGVMAKAGATTPGNLFEGQTAAAAVVFAVSPTGATSIPAAIMLGATPTLTGTCTTASKVGGNTAGKFTATCTAQTVIMTFATTAPNGWDCTANDNTTPADTLKQTAFTTTSCTLMGTTAPSDVITFHAIGF